LFCLTVLSTIALHAQTFENSTFLRLNETLLSLRGAGMGAVSLDDAAKNPAALGSLERALFSLGGTRSDFQLLEITQTDTLPTSRRRALSSSTFSHLQVAVPYRGFVFGAHYLSEPEIRGPGEISRAGQEQYERLDCGSCTVGYYTPVPAFERRDTRYGVTAAYALANVSFGAGVELQQLDESVAINRWIPTEDAFLPHDIVLMRTSDSAIVPHAGVSWRVTPRVTMAAAYNGGGSFDQTIDLCQVSPANPEVCNSEYILAATRPLEMPDAYRASVSIEPVDGFVLAGEVVRRNYSSLAIPYADVNEYHAGGEYRLSDNLTLRAGWWRDPLRYDEGAVNPISDFGQSHDHVTFGTGVDLGGARIDLAYDHADQPSLRRASFGITFGGNMR
jgi:hypothetical protein